MVVTAPTARNRAVFDRPEVLSIHPASTYTYNVDAQINALGHHEQTKEGRDDLRHTHATLALKAGQHPKVVSERLGHATVAFTLDVYSHVVPGMQKQLAEQLGAMVLGDPVEVR